MLEKADLILYAGSLVPRELTECHKPGATVLSSASMALEEQVNLMKRFYDEGKFIVRLHTGDPCIFGAIQEQMNYFDKWDMSYHITPGISSFLAAAAELRSQFTIPERVQTIILDNCHGWKEAGFTPIFGSPSWLIDRERKALWVFSAHQRTTPAVTLRAEDNFYIAYQFRIPALSEGSEVILTVDDLVKQVIFPYETWFTQAGCMLDGKIFYCFGVGVIDPVGRPSRIRVYDTDSGTICAKYNLDEEIPYEMEDLAIRDGWIYVNTNTSIKRGQGKPVVYKLAMPK